MPEVAKALTRRYHLDRESFSKFLSDCNLRPVQIKTTFKKTNEIIASALIRNVVFQFSSHFGQKLLINTKNTNVI